MWKVHREEREGSRGRELLVDKSSNCVSCSCQMFKFDGIPCWHLLANLSLMQIRELPSTYILQRWTKTVKAGRVFDDLGSHQKEICGSSLLVRRQGIFQLACTVLDDAILDEEGTEIVREVLLSSQKKIAFMRGSCQDGSTSSIQLPISFGSQHGLKEPLKVRAKGCGKRLKGGKEKAVKKSRKCHGCGLLGQSHDKRNCPKLMNMSSQDARLYDNDDDNFADECKCLLKNYMGLRVFLRMLSAVAVAVAVVVAVGSHAITEVVLDVMTDFCNSSKLQIAYDEYGYFSGSGFMSQVKNMCIRNAGICSITIYFGMNNKHRF
ncbi:protein FAR1-RELATED SEQUENCE 1-like [Rhododendron vialii]|uniref:protein FAR1-RELATED SEQUENCE 1-like n=1 Tax=Rhododendron vialii TaxID=182163 RepID=UPI00265D9E86|nr:protein FAR1-RELATED SEQUENCE 1-like [Rhododendron vialii]